MSNFDLDKLLSGNRRALAKAITLVESKLDTHRDAAMLARQLTGIACDAPMDDPETNLRRSMPDLGAINALFDEANIGTALRRQAERVSDLSRY